MPKKTPAPPLVAVVDDEPHIVDLVVHYLEAAGYRACSAPDGRTGLELIARERPSCVVLDILMPFLDGRSVLRRLRSNAATVSLPVLILSGTDPDDPANAICGELAQGFIRKPFHPGHVVKGVRQVLGCPPDIAKALAAIHAFRFLGEGDPMELVALYRTGDPQLVYEVPRALGERPEEGLPALLALREPGLLLAVDGPHVVPALTELLDDPDPLLAFHALSALQLHAVLHSPAPRRSPHGSAVFGPRSEAQATVSSERFADIVGSAVAALGKLEPDERRVLLHQLHAFEGTYVTELLRAIAEDDRHELGALARRLLEQRAMPCYPPQLVLAT